MTLHDAARATLADAVEQRIFPGAAYGVLSGGAVAAAGALGRFTYDLASSPVLPGTPYDLASVTKVAATTAVAMQLWQQGRLPLDAPLADLLAGFLIGAPDRARRLRVTLRTLLAHSSGLPAYEPLHRVCHTREQLLQAVLHLPLEAEPGEHAAYSDPGFILLGAALEALTGEPLDALAQRLVFAPLAMQSTQFNPPASWRALIPPTEQDRAFRPGVVQGRVHDENAAVLQGVSGHAGLFAPVNDLLLFADALLAPLRPGAPATLFTPDSVRLFTRRAGPAGSSRALGWDTPSAPSSSGRFFSPSSFGHLGFTGTSLWIDPVADVAIVLLTNRTFPTRENTRIQQLRPLFHDAVMQALGRRTYVSS